LVEQLSVALCFRTVEPVIIARGLQLAAIRLFQKEIFTGGGPLEYWLSVGARVLGSDSKRRGSRSEEILFSYDRECACVMFKMEWEIGSSMGAAWGTPYSDP
jgi:hypothetical protein